MLMMVLFTMNLISRFMWTESSLFLRTKLNIVKAPCSVAKMTLSPPPAIRNLMGSSKI